MKPYPLRFKTVAKERIWGGRKLERFGMELPEGNIGEVWLIADHPNGTTIVADGPLAGWGLDRLRESFGKDWFGNKGLSQKNGRFPLLIKLLDCRDDVSVQVHPSDDYKGLPEGELGKTEMWYILEAQPGASIVFGLHPAVDSAALKKAIEENRIMDCLRRVPVFPGDSFYFPAGTVHAIFAGTVAAEIQQNSDTTYRLYDFDRLGLDGNRRELHIEDSLNVITYGDSGAMQASVENNMINEWLPLTKSPYFVVEKGIVEKEWHLTTAPESFTVIMILEGEGTLRWGSGSKSVKLGDCFLLPANLGEYSLSGSFKALRTYLP
ncbi:type I phosphomannose isomerase catalytic subunit [Cohnella nanjingensis]|uniref:Mannose-6-phosphate isomerase n=1 Tax=Cohnella nanjingensis TaxID=1387779 RepID=A0A7X0RQU5_9BACL|nr:type I phosphomannose isomerase catalytic subunit [Cohnella nanjingensis]MBB6670801.1 class I mannose-6-phosphate isomerase [Cohnella nanjingensis]